MSPSSTRRASAAERAAQLGFLQAINQAQTEEMARDERVVLMGQDLRANVFGAADGVLQRFGPARVRDLPLSEAGSVGLAAGAAMAGLRPVVDLTVASFVFGAMDQFVSQLAKARYMFGGQARLPVVIRAALYYHGGTAGHHADRPYPMFMNVPGLKIILPSNATDLKGLLKSAIRDDNPVLCFEDANLSGWTVRNANFSGLSISKADLRGASFVDCLTAGMTIEGIAVNELMAAYWAVTKKMS